jgi:hypothetical protein
MSNGSEHTPEHQTDRRWLPEDAWYAFQDAAYEPGSQQRFESALDTDPDLLDGVLGVVKWAREKARAESQAHQITRIWQERPGEFSYRCACGTTVKHMPFSPDAVVTCPEADS